MSPLLALDVKNTKKIAHTAQDTIDALAQELEKGIQSIKNGEVYTLEEAWAEIDKI